MSRQTDTIVRSLMEGGIIGVVLSTLISKNNKGGDSLIGAIAGAAIMASVKATENARKTDIPLVLEENNVLYEVYSNGRKKFIKHLSKSGKTLPKKFTLK